MDKRDSDGFCIIMIARREAEAKGTQPTIVDYTSIGLVGKKLQEKQALKAAKRKGTYKPS